MENSKKVIEDLEIGPSIDNLEDGEIGEEKYDGIIKTSSNNAEGVESRSVIIQMPRESSQLIRLKNFEQEAPSQFSVFEYPQYVKAKLSHYGYP